MLPISSKPIHIFVIEDDAIEQKKRKAMGTCGQRDLAEILLELRKLSSMDAFCSRDPSSSPLHPIDKRRRLLHEFDACRDYVSISDDEEDVAVVPNNKSIINNNPSKGEGQSDFIIPAINPLPIGRPLPPAPQFPRCLPGTTITL
jgi:hypothetical protein